MANSLEFPTTFLMVRGPSQALNARPGMVTPTTGMATVAAGEAPRSRGEAGFTSGSFAIGGLAAAATAVATVVQSRRRSLVRRKFFGGPGDDSNDVRQDTTTSGFEVDEGSNPLLERDRQNNDLNDGSTGNLTKVQWMRRVRRVDARHVIYDVRLPKPLGMRLETFPNRPGIGVREIIEGANAHKNNDDVIFNQADGMWILEGDELVAVSDQVVVGGEMDDALALIGDAGDEVTLTFKRNTRGGPIKVVFFPSASSATVKRNITLSAACAYAGLDVKFGCTDGWCGTCWHRERSTNGVMKPCCGMLTNDWDSTLPLVLTLSPEKVGKAGVDRSGQDTLAGGGTR